MIRLITYPAMGSAFSLSPFCCKAALLLDYADVVWQREDTSDPRRMPHGKLPAIRTPDGQIIGDSDAIRQYLEDRGADFQPRLNDMQKAHSRALVRMAEEHLYFNVMLDRWGRDDVWPVIRELYFKDIPALMRRPIANGLRREVLRGMKSHGLARFTEDERAARVEQDLKAFSDLLWQGPFLMGGHVTLVDMCVAPVLNAMRQTPVETPLALRVAGDALLVDYIDRVTDAVSNVNHMKACA